jgi:hypothetical protein
MLWWIFVNKIVTLSSTQNNTTGTVNSQSCHEEISALKPSQSAMGRCPGKAEASTYERRSCCSFHLQILQPILQNTTSTQSNVPHEVVIEAPQRQLHRRLMKELLDSAKVDKDSGKKSSDIYRTMTREKRSKAIFFYFHDSLGSLDMELTCSMFSININTFTNLVKQKRYYEKWWIRSQYLIFYPLSHLRFVRSMTLLIHQAQSRSTRNIKPVILERNTFQLFRLEIAN